MRARATRGAVGLFLTEQAAVQEPKSGLVRGVMRLMLPIAFVIHDRK